MDDDRFFAPKIWDFAYPTGRAPTSTPTSSPLLKSVDAPVFESHLAETTILPSISRQESASSSSSSSSYSSNSLTSLTSSNSSNPSTPSTPETAPQETTTQQETSSLPAWAHNLPKEYLGKDGLVTLLFPTNTTPKEGDSEQLGYARMQVLAMEMGMARNRNRRVGGRERGAVGEGKTGGICRPGHPVLKLRVEERDRV